MVTSNAVTPIRLLASRAKLTHFKIIPMSKIKTNVSLYRTAT